jgi:hypothetical protein
MSDLCRLVWWALIGLFRSRAALEAEILVLKSAKALNLEFPRLLRTLADEIIE